MRLPGFLLLAGLPTLAAAEGAPTELIHLPPDAEAPALALDVGYTGELAINAAGGLRRGTRYLDNLTVALDAHLGARSGWRDTTVRLSGLYNNGSSISDLIGDSQVVSNIETGVRAVRLYEAWAEHRSGAFSAKAGLYDVNSEFDVLESATFFTSSAHGIGTDIGQSGQNGPAIFPFTALALRLSADLAPGVTLRAAVIDGVPGDPERPTRTAIHLGNGDGALLMGEADMKLGDWRVLAGHWRYTASFDAFDGGHAHGNQGWYLRGERSWDLAEGRKLSAFTRLGVADGRFNPFDRFVAAGVVLDAPFRARPQDAVGFGVSSAITSPHYRRWHGAKNAETVVEASYRLTFGERLNFQPTVQWVINPGMASDIEDALFVGIRLGWGFMLALAE